MEDKQIPDDIVFDILLKLPVESLVRFTAVSKTWSSLIKSPKFIAAHQSYMNLGRRFSNIEDDSYLFSSEPAPGDINLQEQPKLTNLPPGFRCFEIIGRPCHGLLCLNLRYNANGRSGIFLWNPSIGKFKTLDTFPYRYDSYAIARPDFVVYGFGYDECSDDHRVVRVNYYTNKKDKSRLESTKRVYIYSVSKGSWREIRQAEVPNYLRKHVTSGMYFDGAVHWVTRKRRYYYGYRWFSVLNSIVSFDFRREIFRDIELPSEIQKHFDHFVDINEFKGSLALLISQVKFGGGQFYLWVMDEYGVEGSWNKKFTIDLPREFSQWPAELMKDGIILWGTKSKEEYTFVLYNVEDGISKNWKDVRKLDGFAETECLLLLDSADDMSNI